MVEAVYRDGFHALNFYSVWLSLVNADFHIIQNRTYLFVQGSHLLPFSGSNAIKHTFAAARFRGMSAGNFLLENLALMRRLCAEEFWLTAAILYFIGDI